MRNDQTNETAVWENVQEQFEKVSCRMRLSIGDRKHVAPILSARSVLEGAKLIGRRRNRRHLHHPKVLTDLFTADWHGYNKSGPGSPLVWSALTIVG